MQDNLHEECGVFGIYDNGDDLDVVTLYLLWLFMRCSIAGRKAAASR